ncbi:MAG: 50S ribosomal protein L25 [Anaerolineaceae bacterium]|nr:50S ribosomal protein L25 [Anaerolineaceae bacterium]
MEKVVIQVEPRTVIGKQVGALRRAGKLPGVIYGHNIQPTPILMDLRTASRILAGLTASSLVSINLDGKETSALVREKQRDFIRGTLLHVDFQAVSLTEKIRTKVGVELVGLAPAVKDFNAVIVNGLDALEVEAFPQDLPERFTVDISQLKELGDAIHVRDIIVSEKVTVLDQPDEMIVLATVSKEEEEAPVAEVSAAEEPEIIERGKKEEEEEGEKD